MISIEKADLEAPMREDEPVRGFGRHPRIVCPPAPMGRGTLTIIYDDEGWALLCAWIREQDPRGAARAVPQARALPAAPVVHDAVFDDEEPRR